MSANHSGSVGALSRRSTDDGVRWNTYSSLHAPCELRDALHGGRAGADDRNPLVTESIHRRAVGVAAGVVVVPAARVERVALERLEPGDARQLRHVERPGTHRRRTAR